MKLERSNPLAANVPPRAILDLMSAIEEENHELHSLMLVKSGKVIFERYWEPFGADYRHQLFSLSKSFTSTAVGFAVQEGLLTVDTKISDIFKAEFEQLENRMDDEVRDITIKNLLTMSTGMEYEGWDDAGKGNILSFLASHIKDAPGQTFRYSTISTFMCSAALTRVAGMHVVAYLKPRLFEPLGIENYFWEKEKGSGISFGGVGFNITTEDIAKFGQFILQKGMWNGKQLLNVEWVEEATAKQIENGEDPNNDWNCGYGYQFWRCIPDGVFRGDGMYGQFCVLVPEQDLVIAATSNVDLGRVLKLFWKMLDDMKTLPIIEADADKLDAIPYLSHLSSYEIGDEYPKLYAEYQTDDGLTFHLDFNEHDGVLAVYKDAETQPVLTYFFEHEYWTKGASPSINVLSKTPVLFEGRMFRTINFGAWKGRVFKATTWYYETACKDEMRFTFNEDFSEVSVEYRSGAFDAPFKEVYKGKR